MTDNNDLVFKIRETVDGVETIRDPVWVEIKLSNTECPVCRCQAIPILGHQGILYLICTICKRTFRGT
jgi:formate dehydrogenase maturation protein FdhE